VTHLDTDHLDEIAPRVPVPDYPRGQVRPGIVHIGVGGFHRSHLAMYVDRLLATTEDATALDWGITGVGLLPGDARMAEVLHAQDSLYTLVLKHPDGSVEPRVIGSLVGYLHAPGDPEAVLDAMTAPATRIVSMTITEGGYHQNQSTGEFDSSDPDIQAELRGEGPRTAFGFLAAALARRRGAGVPAFTVMCCDNIPGNGDVTRKMLTSYVRLSDPELADWIEAEVRFPNSMVDRITPVTTDADREALSSSYDVQDGWPVVAEPFTQWVLEDHFGELGRPDFAAVGAQLVDDVEPYELMKLRLLNASHQALCYVGYLAGYRYAHEVCQDPLFVDYLLRYMDTEGSPSLPEVPGVDLTAYKHELISRFANPQIRDTLARLCAESSDRIPKWLVPVIAENLEAGRPVRSSALIVASWARYAEGVDEHGEPIEVVDRRKDEVMARAAQQDQDPLAFLRDPALFGDLVEHREFTEPYVEALESLKKVGARATLEAWADARSLHP
jgi:mannitol 2-dehydrogenase